MVLQSLGNMPYATVINAILRTAFRRKAKVAIWKQPEQKQWKLLVALHDEKPAASLPEILEGRKGFLLSPFANICGSGNLVFLEADGVLEKSAHDLSWTWSETADRQLREQFETSLGQVLDLDNDPDYTSHIEDYTLSQLLAKPQFMLLAEKAVEEIKNGAFSKVVVARAANRNVPKIINFGQLFDRLSELYQEAFVSLVYLPGEGFWVGASPETLLESDDNRHGKTVALAGTIVREKGMDPAMCSWSTKEINEHDLVSQFIDQVLRENGIHNFAATRTASHAIAHLFHLRKDFAFDLRHPDNRHGDLAALLYGLHPTPAVCGLPKQKALDFILRHESFDRSFYSGFCGPVNIDQKISLFVNIRCMNIKGQRATLYAGAGITIDSDPAKEWEETGMKMKMMANMLDKEVRYFAYQE